MLPVLMVSLSGNDAAQRIQKGRFRHHLDPDVTFAAGWILSLAFWQLDVNRKTNYIQQILGLFTNVHWPLRILQQDDNQKKTKQPWQNFSFIALHFYKQTNSFTVCVYSSGEVRHPPGTLWGHWPERPRQRRGLQRKCRLWREDRNLTPHS